MASSKETDKLHALGNYRMAHLLGYNGIVATYKAFEQETLLPVALVAIHKSALRNYDVWPSFTKEFESLVHQSASRLCQPFACGDMHDHFWAAYEWQTGQHLGVVVRDYGLPQRSEAFQWMSELSDAVSTLHRRGYAHRIISPASIFITDYYQAKLLHSCWGRILTAVDGGMLNPEFMSILPFLSPEVAAGEDADEAADVYGIGAALYFLITGMPPFWHDDPQTLLQMIREDTLDLAPLVEQITPEGVEVLEDMLQRNPEDRPLNMPALVDRLESLAKAVQQIEAAEPRQVEEPPADELETHRVAVPTPEALQSADQVQTGESSRNQFEQPIPEQVQGYFPPTHDPNMPGPAEHYRSGEGYPMGTPDHQLPPPSFPPPPDAHPHGHAITHSAQPPKKSIMLPLLLGGGLLLVAVAGVGAAVMFGLFSGGGDNPAPKPDNLVQNTGPKTLSVTEIEKYDTTVKRITALGQLAIAYEKRDGKWPAALTDLKPLGATDEMMKDAWNRPLEARDAFVVSLGPDGKSDTKDDFWYDAELRALGGWSPTLQ